MKLECNSDSPTGYDSPCNRCSLCDGYIDSDYQCVDCGASATAKLGSDGKKRCFCNEGHEDSLNTACNNAAGPGYAGACNCQVACALDQCEAERTRRASRRSTA